VRACVREEACKYVRLFAYVGCKIQIKPFVTNMVKSMHALYVGRSVNETGSKIWGQNAKGIKTHVP